MNARTGDSAEKDRIRPRVIARPTAAMTAEVEAVVKLLDELIEWWPNRPLPTDPGGGVGRAGGSAHLRWARDTFRDAEVVQPPRPDEPTGIGAVVEAIHNNLFVRVSTGDHPWQRVSDMEGECHCEWRDIDAVRVLAEGVPDA